MFALLSYVRGDRECFDINFTGSLVVVTGPMCKLCFHMSEVIGNVLNIIAP